MRYHYREGVNGGRKQPRWIVWLLVVIVLGASAYLVVNHLAPQLMSLPLAVLL